MAEQAGHWLTLGNPHAGPFTVGSEDTALWSNLASSMADISSRGPLGSSTVDRHFSLLTGHMGERRNEFTQELAQNHNNTTLIVC